MSQSFWLTPRHYWCLMFHADVAFVLPYTSPLLWCLVFHVLPMSGVPCWCRICSGWHVAIADVWCSMLMSHSFHLTCRHYWCLVFHAAGRIHSGRHIAIAEVLPMSGVPCWCRIRSGWHVTFADVWWSTANVLCFTQLTIYADDPILYCVSPNSSSTFQNIVVTMISNCVFVLTNDVCTVHLT